MPFTGPKLNVQHVGGCEFMLTAPLHYQGAVDHFTVPSGTVTDFATVPKRLQSIVQATGPWTLSAVLHDWLCTKGIETGAVTSRDADGIFRRVMREEGVGFVTRWCMWTAVRWAAPFSKHRRPSGIVRDLPRLLPISVAVLAVAAPFVAAFVLGLRELAHLIIDSI